MTTIKSCGYTSLIRAFYNQDLDKNRLSKNIDESTLIKQQFSIKYTDNKGHLLIYKPDEFSFNLYFTGFKRCSFIRKYYCLINLIK